MKRNWILIVAGMTLLLSACKPKAITENEKKGLKEVTSIYGGKVKYLQGDSAVDTSEEKRFFELQLSKSKFIELYKESPELTASGVAYAFYKKLGNDKQKYTHIKSELILNNGNKLEYEYPVNELEIVNTKIKIADKIIALIKQGNFDAIKPMLDDSSFAKYNKDEFIANLKETDSHLEKVNELVIIGFRFYKIYGKDILHISGQLMRGTQANAFSIDLDPSDVQERAVMINYKI
jgi:hypothetical protein